LATGESGALADLGLPVAGDLEKKDLYDGMSGFKSVIALGRAYMIPF
jgi:hypothetical protein